MNLKKLIAIGVIALFLGLMVIPVNGSVVEKQERKIPVELSMLNTDGSMGSQIFSLTESQVRELSDLIENFKNNWNKGSILEKIRAFFHRCGYKGNADIFDIALLNLLPGNPIISIGVGRELLTRYHGRIQAKKIVSAWHYPDLGLTMIWGKNKVTPKQILLQRQMGLMIGFVGLYLYIPPVIEYMPSKTCFIGTALFAWGVSL